MSVPFAAGTVKSVVKKKNKKKLRVMPHAPHTPSGTAAPRSPTGSPSRRTSTAKSGMTTAQRKRSYGAMIDR